MVQAPPRNITLVNLTPGRVEPVTLRLPPGQWDLSLGYVSGQAITITGGGLDVRLPPNLDRPGSLWTVGRVTSTGAPILLIVSMSDPDLIASTQYFLPSRLVAVRAGRTHDDSAAAGVWALRGHLRAQLTCRAATTDRYRRRRSPRIESKNDEKKIWMPTMISVAASTASRSCASAPKPCSIQLITINAPTTAPASAIDPPSSSPCSSL